jgi:hypothetical protein
MKEKKKVEDVTLETYMGDMARVVSDSSENGMIKKVIEEEEKHGTENKRKSPENQMNKIFLSVGAVLIILAFVAVSLVFFFRKEIFTVEVKQPYVPIIFTDQTAFKEISNFKKEQITQTILNEAKTAEFKIGGIEGIYLTLDKKVLGFRKFLELINANLDQTKIPFINDNFLIGATNKEGIDLFILLKMRSIADVFEGMRLWESKMFFDLHGFFGMELNSETKYLLTKDFEDGIVQNKNARILRDNEGEIIMMYIFAEEDSLIITNSEIAVKEAMLRLASSTLKK